MEKPDPYRLSCPHVVTINGLQVLLNSITCLPSYPTGRRYLPYSSPTQYTCLIQSENDPQDPRSHSLYPRYKSGLRTLVQHWFSLELASCSNSVSHSNKLYFPLILSHVWKFFSNPHPDHNTSSFLVTKWSEVAQAWPTLCDPMDCSPPGSSIHAIFRARVLEDVAISFSRGSSWPRDWTQVFCIAGRCFSIRAIREDLSYKGQVQTAANKGKEDM